MSERVRLFRHEEARILDEQNHVDASPSERRRFSIAKKSALIGLLAVGSVAVGVINEGSEDGPDIASFTQRDQALVEKAEELEREERLAQLERHDTARVDRLREAQEAQIERKNDPHLNDDEVIVLAEEPTIQEHAEIFVEVGKEFDINPNYLATLAWIETCGNPDSKNSSVGAEGFMQVMPSSAKWATDTFDIESYDPSQPADSIRVGAAVLALHMTDFDSKDYVPDGAIDNYEVQFALYNGGPGQAGPFVTSDYDRAAMVDQTETFVYEADYILNELPVNGDHTKCKGDPAIDRVKNNQ
ncbi:MAG: lytic transglycosylase domain-containing protein [Actinobacteria bacterium]|nr:lytic transglycosylase domain-containing protein [Actinomycetota bacterium]